LQVPEKERNMGGKKGTNPTRTKTQQITTPRCPVKQGKEGDQLKSHFNGILPGGMLCSDSPRLKGLQRKDCLGQKSKSRVGDRRSRGTIQGRKKSREGTKKRLIK